MADVFSKKKRSDVMSRIRGRGNKETELALAALLRLHSIKGWRRHWPVEGTPDFAFPQHRVAIFVDGCFWHVCPNHTTNPATNREFWRNKLSGNRIRDKYVNQVLRRNGWKVVRIWEHSLKKQPALVIRRIKDSLQPRTREMGDWKK